MLGDLSGGCWRLLHFSPVLLTSLGWCFLCVGLCGIGVCVCVCFFVEGSGILWRGEVYCLEVETRVFVYLTREVVEPENSGEKLKLCYEFELISTNIEPFYLRC